jgi:hypothetical protein
MRRKAGVIKAELAAAEDETHELTGIVVHEVSVVDRPANRRKFLLVKRDASTDEQKDPGMKLQGAKKDALLKAMKGLQDTAAAITKEVEGATVADAAPIPTELQRALEGIAALTGALIPQAATPAAVPGVTPEPAVKAGRKLSTARSAKLQQATTMLVELLTEIAGAPATESTDEDEPTEGTAKAATKPASKSVAVPAAPATDPALMATLTTLTEGLASLTKAVKRQKDRLDEMSTSAPGSNQVRSELTEEERVRAQKSKPVSWPLDMNDPITKENTPAEISFFD